jgi:hypothetical protein
MNRVRKQFRAILIVASLAAPAAWAQQQQQGDTRVNPPVQPIPPLKTGDSSTKKPANGEDGVAQDESGQTKTPPPPLSGAERYSVDSAGRAHNYILPSIQFSETGDTNPVNLSGQSGILSASIIGGQLSLNRVLGRSKLTATFAGGGAFYNNNSSLNSEYGQLAVSEKVSLRRWSLLLSDYLTYLPQSGFGGGGVGGFGAPITSGLSAIGLPSDLSPGIASSQSILTARAQRIDNASFGEVDYQFSARSSFTATVGYDLLQFLNGGFPGSHTYVFRGGYNRNLTAKDTFGVIYDISFFRYQTPGNDVQNHFALVSYGRLITGRLALQLGAGPQINRLGPAAGNGSRTPVSWGVTSSLSYRFSNTSTSLFYNHYTTAGAGVFYGSITDEAGTGVTRRLSRAWSGSVNAVFARNRPLQQVIGQPSINGYKTWSAGGSVSRPLSPYTILFFNYSLQWQSSGACVAVGPVACGTSYFRHVFGAGFSWSFRPVELN